MVDPVTRCPQCGITVFQSSDSTTPYCSGHQPPEGVDPATVYLDVTLDGGKYRLIYHSDAKRPQAFRHGVPHGPTQDRMTANSFRTLVERVAELEEQAGLLIRDCAINPLTSEGEAAYKALRPLAPAHKD